MRLSWSYQVRCRLGLVVDPSSAAPSPARLKSHSHSLGKWAIFKAKDRRKELYWISLLDGQRVVQEGFWQRRRPATRSLRMLLRGVRLGFRMTMTSKRRMWLMKRTRTITPMGQKVSSRSHSCLPDKAFTFSQQISTWVIDRESEVGTYCDWEERDISSIPTSTLYDPTIRESWDRTMPGYNSQIIEERLNDKTAGPGCYFFDGSKSMSHPPF